MTTRDARNKQSTRGFCLLLLALGLVCMSSGAMAARHALVIANSAYEDKPLKPDSSEAEAVAEVLRRARFQVELGLDNSRGQMQRTVRAFVAGLQPGDQVVVYFSGKRASSYGETYLLGIDSDPRDIRPETTDASLYKLVDLLERAKTAVRIVLVNACEIGRNDRWRFNGPTSSSQTTSAGTLLQVTQCESGGGSNPNEGVSYVRHLLREIQRPGVDAATQLRNVDRAMRAESGLESLTIASSPAPSDFYFFGRAINPVGTAPDASIPTFPSPVPQPSATMTLSLEALGFPANQGPSTLGEVDHRLVDALDKAGYFERRYFAFPGGFALVTRLERFEPNGEPTRGNLRWAENPSKMAGFSLEEYLRRLFTAPSGRFRFITFLVSNEAVIGSGAKTTRDEYLDLFGRGVLNDLPRALEALPTSTGSRCTILIYEFAKSAAEPAPTQVQPSSLSAFDHLAGAALLPALRVKR